MVRYSFPPRDRIILKGYGFLSFAQDISKNIAQNKSKTLSGKYSQKSIDHVKQYVNMLQMRLKLLVKEQFKNQ